MDDDAPWVASDPFGRLRRAWPAAHDRFVRSVLPLLYARDGARAVLLGGSLVNGGSDSYSDIDLTVVCDPEVRDEWLEGERLARELGALSAFRGDHLREPRLLICLFEPPLLHVDLKLVTPVEAGERVEPRAVLFCKDSSLRGVFDAPQIDLPGTQRDWTEPRVWTWLHYGGSKAARGEVFECLDLLAFLRGRVLAPMALMASGHTGLAVQGTRRVETRAPAYLEALTRCVPEPSAASCFMALGAARELYVMLRSDLGWSAGEPRLEAAVSQFLTMEQAKLLAG
ncbi:MAG: nucleotidyltransferase domain-containing protein [Myxococcales bacterium]|nr:nucleotidyltransferase domain-containing protein [Myxococcales bacterium]